MTSVIVRVIAIFVLVASLAGGCMIASAAASSVTVDKSIVYIQNVSSMNINYTISSSNYDNADVVIYSRPRTPVKLTARLYNVKAGVKYTTHWDGTDDRGRTVSAGEYYVLLDAYNLFGGSNQTWSDPFNLVVDYSAPVTSASPGAGSAWRSSRTVDLVAQDSGGAGLANIKYELSSSPTTTHSYTTYSGSSLAISLNDGTNYLTYYSTDNAGNIEALHENMVYYCDPYAPTISGAVTSPTTTSNGWYTGDVTVHFTASDTLSGVASKTADQTLTGSGSGQSVTGTATDNAGNSATATVSNIKIDKVTPALTWSAVGASLINGWYNRPLTIHFSPTVGPSGVSAITQDMDRTASSGPITGTLTDGAGRTATVTTGAIKIDTDAPVISNSRTPEANGHGWNNVPVTVSFSASDVNSGLATNSSNSSTVMDGADQTVSWTATDNAGNTAIAQIDHISVDTAGPSLSAAYPSANAYGWYNDSVIVQYSYSDDLSGIDQKSVPANYLFSGEGAGQSTTANVSDLAGNTASLTTADINIDRTAPTITLTITPAPAASGWYTSRITVNLTASDATSGVSTVQYSLDNQNWNDYTGNLTLTDGMYTFYYRATDRADNTATHDKTINIDGMPSVTSAALAGTAGENGWYTTYVRVTLNVTAGLSGLDHAEYSYDGVTWITGDTYVLDTEGLNTTYYRGVDKAGNVELGRALSVKIDLSAPSVSGSLGGHVSHEGWFDSDVTLSLTSADSVSGVNNTEYCMDGVSWNKYTGPVTIGLDIQKTVYYRAIDNAGLVTRKDIFVYFPPKSFDTGLWMAGSNTTPTPTATAIPADTLANGSVPSSTVTGTATPPAGPSPSATADEPTTQANTSGQWVIIPVFLAVIAVAGVTLYLLRFRR